jgi:hypothetical protein
MHPFVPDSAREVDGSIRIDEGKWPVGFLARRDAEDASGDEKQHG